ncbi:MULTISPECIES: hypothetical protein [unclassified Paenibacillus]|uniref:hypothetical protein n=2 Tax=Paenibacillus TaxID=44249 RepID=UPI0009C5AA83|nr:MULTISPECIES: hypothetical protein [unclassified Paenibacillus]SLK16657.1 hypothetical protein SAMN06272722_110217 [Paenibacillus sp. RU5A]SOC74431.1 hypothetical protein SAMN05880581_110217 [Paenibacillus sp. RU26A]SOC76604.1 hypothetical protein SAMN05880586_110217 [Paenibacillus sp. RU5M]
MGLNKIDMSQASWTNALRQMKEEGVLDSSETEILIDKVRDWAYENRKEQISYDEPEF